MVRLDEFWRGKNGVECAAAMGRMISDEIQKYGGLIHAARV